MADRLADGRAFRMLTLVDNFSRVSPAIEVDFSLTGKRVVEVLKRLKVTHGVPKTIKVDNVLPTKASLPQRQTPPMQGGSCFSSYL